jgi:carbon-monoxide dehydrogenase large subunit
MGGSALLMASDELVRFARELAATRLEASPDDIVIHHDGHIGVAGVPAKSLTWAELARAVGERRLMAEADFKADGGSFPFGAHLSVVEVDIETGQVRPLRHVAVDDCGRVLNPLLVAGQQHGGIAQGIAQALWEEIVYDAESNPLTSNLTDYAMPTAAEFQEFECYNTVTETFRNPLGAKGVGESGTVGATPAVHNAVIDALAHLGVRHIPMPCTPRRVWEAIQRARSLGPTPPWSDPPSVFA